MNRPERSLQHYRTRHLESHRQAIAAADLRLQGQGERSGTSFGKRLYTRRNFLLMGAGSLAGFSVWFHRRRFTPVHTWDRLPQTPAEWLSFHTPWGHPEADFEIGRPAYAFGFSQETKLARWIGFKAQIGPQGKAPPKMFDPDFSSDDQGSEKLCGQTKEFECAALIGYGLVADAPNAREAIGYYSVRGPQRTYLNRTLFKQLDHKAENIAKRKRQVWVMLGPVFKEVIPYRSEVKIPSHYYYVLIRKSRALGYQQEAYLLPQNADDISLDACRISLEALEELLGTPLFPNASWR